MEIQHLNSQFKFKIEVKKFWISEFKFESWRSFKIWNSSWKWKFKI